MSSTRVLEHSNKSQSDKLALKTFDSPFLTIGLIGLAAACAIGAYKFKSKGNMRTSVFLMQLRVAAQGSLVVALTAGSLYQLVTEHFLKDASKTHKH